MGLQFLEATGVTVHKYGAGERAYLTLARQASQRGHRLHVLWEGPSNVPAFVDDLKAAGAMCHIYRTQGRSARGTMHLTKLIRRHQIDLVHAHFRPAQFPALLAAKATRRPSLLTIHQILAPHPKTNRLRKRSQLIAAAAVRLATQAEAVSHAARDAYVNRGLAPDSMHVHHIGIRPIAASVSKQAMRQALGISEERVVIACTAFHDPIKGVDVLVRALAHARQTDPRLLLLQIGGEPDASKTALLKDLSAQLGVAEHIVWTGFRNDVPDLLAAADIYVQPSRMEGLGLAILEAASAGLPLVGTQVGGIPEIIRHGVNGLLVPPEHPAQLGDALVELARDPSVRARFSDHARDISSEHFDLDTQIGVQLDRYEAMVHNA